MVKLSEILKKQFNEDYVVATEDLQTNLESKRMFVSIPTELSNKIEEIVKENQNLISKSHFIEKAVRLFLGRIEDEKD